MSDLYLLDLSNDLEPRGDPKCLSVGKGRAGGLDWTVDGRSLVFSMYSGGSSSLWRVAVSGPSQLQRMTPIGTDARSPAISRRGNRLAYAHAVLDWNIWRMGMPSPNDKAGTPVKLAFSTRSEKWPVISPDGKKIGFVSDRSGTQEVWLCDADGSNPVQLTFFPEAWIVFGANGWSPDGTRLAFSAALGGKSDIYLVNVSGGGLLRLIPDRSETSFPFWSRDGNWIFFDMVDSGKLGIYRSPAEGGTPVLVADDPGWEPSESHDGRFVYYYKTAADGIEIGLWRVPSSGGEKQQILDLVQNNSVQIAEDGFYFTRPEKETSGVSLQFLNTSTGRIQRIASWPKAAHIFSVSPDRRWIIYDQLDQEGSDLMLVENFR